MEGHEQRPDVDCVAIGELDWHADALAAAKRAVLAPEILEDCSVRLHHDPRVTAGHRRSFEPDVNIWIASDDVFPDGQRKALAVPLEPARGSVRSRFTAARQRCGVSAKRVAEPVRS